MLPLPKLTNHFKSHTRHQKKPEMQLIMHVSRYCILTSVTHLFHAGGFFEENEAEASGPAGVGVHLDGAVRHLSELCEVILQVLFTRVPTEATHEHFTANTKGNVAGEFLIFYIKQPKHLYISPNLC